MDAKNSAMLDGSGGGEEHHQLLQRKREGGGGSSASAAFAASRDAGTRNAATKLIYGREGISAASSSAGGAGVCHMSGVQWSFCVALFGFFIYCFVDSFTNQDVYATLSALLTWLKHLDYFTFSVAYTLLMVALVSVGVPVTIWAIGGGFVFAEMMGFWLGVVLCTIMSFLGCTIGSIIGFLIGRYVLQDCAQDWLSQFSIMRKLDIGLITQGTKICILLRLSPICPWNMLQYMMGLTSVSTSDWIASSIGMLPYLAIVVYFGATMDEIGSASAGTTTSGNTNVDYIFYGVGVLLIIVLTVMIHRYTQRAIDEAIQTEEAGVEAVATAGGGAGIVGAFAARQTNTTFI